MLESAGFEKSQIFVAIEPDDLVQYEENERIVPVESRIPQANMLLVEEPKSSADTLAEVRYSLLDFKRNFKNDFRVYLNCPKCVMVFQTTYWLYMLIFYTVEYFVNLPNSIEQQIQHLHLFMGHQQKRFRPLQHFQEEKLFIKQSHRRN